MKCASCETELTPGERFCGECGQPVEEPVREGPPATNAALEVVCSQCGAALKPNKKFCGSCGKPVAIEAPRPRAEICRSCGTPLEPGERFCGKCGVPLGTTATLHADSRLSRKLPSITAAAPQRRHLYALVTVFGLALVGLLSVEGFLLVEFILFGLIVGIIASLFRREADFRASGVTILLAIGGAVLGSFLSLRYGYYHPDRMALIGSTVLVVLYRIVSRRSA